MTGEALNPKARIIILVVAFLNWFFGGVQTGLTNLGRPAAEGLLDLAGWAEGIGGAARGKLIDRWASYLQCAFLFGAAAGGWIFGRLGDRLGRTRALGISIIWFSALTGLAYFARNPAELFAIRFVACLGVGGCWPNGVALVSEAWSSFARPIIASMIGMAGNIGIFAFSSLLVIEPVTPDSFRWVFLVGACSLPLGILILFLASESPAWLAARQTAAEPVKGDAPRAPSVFRKPYLGVTLVGIALAKVPLFGGWGSFQWIVFWGASSARNSACPNSKRRSCKCARSPASSAAGWLRSLRCGSGGGSPTFLLRSPRCCSRSTSSGSPRPPTATSCSGSRSSAFATASSSAGCPSSCRSCLRPKCAPPLPA